jgi:regulator of nucleoside diphosphate kinase
MENLWENGLFAIQGKGERKMKNRQIYVTTHDLNRLEELLSVAESFNYRDRNDLKNLELELHKAKIVKPEEVPSGIVTMNSQVVLRDMDDQTEMKVALVFPSDSNIDEGKLSVLSPIGTAILGYAEGDIIEWTVPAGTRHIHIEKIVYQPEASGHYHL